MSLRNLFQARIRIDDETDALGNSLICDCCGKHTGQGGTHGLGAIKRRVCLDCLHHIEAEIDNPTFVVSDRE